MPRPPPPLMTGGGGGMEILKNSKKGGGGKSKTFIGVNRKGVGGGGDKNVEVAFKDKFALGMGQKDPNE